MTSLSRLSSGVRKSVLPTIPESPDVKVHCLSSDSEFEGDDFSDAKVASCEFRFESTMSNRKPFQSDGVGNSDSRYPNLTQATHDEDGGNLEAANDSVEFAYPSDETASEETIRASVWTASMHRGHIADSNSNHVAFETPSRVSISESRLKSTPQSVLVGYSGLQSPSSGGAEEVPRSIMELLLAVCGRLSAKSQLASANLASFRHEVVQFLPTEYNGNVIFKLQSLPVVKEGGVARLDDMDRRFDGHAWTETATTNIVDPSRLLSFKYVKCMGHLRCSNPDCRHIKEMGDYNEMYWSGSSPDVLTPGPSSKPSPKCKLVCKHCRRTPSCLVLCPCRMFYIVSKDPLMSKACIHIGTHGHLVAKGHCRDALIQIREKVKDEVARTPNATPSAISLAVGKELLM